MANNKLRRLIWCDIVADFKQEDDIERFVRWCQDVGIEAVLPCVNHGTGVMCYPSRLVPTAVGYDSWDPLGLLIEKCHLVGIEVHPWLVVANWGSSLLPHMKGERYIAEGPPPLQEAHPEWFAVDMYGHSVIEAPSVAFGPGGTCFLDPGHPDVRNFLMELVTEMFDRYPEADGLHLDYIRYESITARMEWDIRSASDLGRYARLGDGLWISRPSEDYSGADDIRLYYEIVGMEGDGIERRPQRLKLERHYKYCYCDRCLHSFASAHQIRYPEGADTKAKHDWIWEYHEDDWVKWRADQVTELVRRFSRLVRGKYQKQLSAATFWNHPPVIRSHGQDWISWINEGLLDFVNPMTYWIPPDKVQEMTASYINRRETDCPVYPGIITSGGYRVEPEDVGKYVAAIRQGGGEGITLFCYSTWGDVARWDPDIGDQYRKVLAAAEW